MRLTLNCRISPWSALPLKLVSALQQRITVELRPPLAATAFDECFSTSDSHTKQLFASSTCSSQGFYAVTGWDPPSHTSDLIYNQIRRFNSTLTSTPSPKPSNSPRSAIPPTSKLLENFPDNLYPGAPPSSSRLIPEPRPTSPPSNLPRPAASNQRFYLNSSSHSRSPSILSSSSPSLLPRLFMFYLNPDSQPHTLPSQL